MYISIDWNNNFLVNYIITIEVNHKQEKSFITLPDK
jgi:hypothetical protein